MPSVGGWGSGLGLPLAVPRAILIAVGAGRGPRLPIGLPLYDYPAMPSPSKRPGFLFGLPGVIRPTLPGWQSTPTDTLLLVTRRVACL